MVPENLEKPRVTEIQVRMDCNGCVQKIKKALYGITGIYDHYIDFPQQKLTIVGWADPEKIVKAIRKTRKNAIICSHTEPTDQPAAQPTEPPSSQQAPEGGGAPPSASDAPNPAQTEAPRAEAAPAEPPKDTPPPPPENPPPEEKPSPSSIAAEANTSQAAQPTGPEVGEVHVLYHHPPDYGYRYGYGHNYGGHWNRNVNGQGFPPEQVQPTYVTHSYNTYRSSPYVTEYQYAPSPPWQTNYSYSRMDHYNEDYRDNSRNGNITSMFSDENPNACTIM